MRKNILKDAEKKKKPEEVTSEVEDAPPIRAEAAITVEQAFYALPRNMAA